jgi:hypothetical protein
LIPLSEVDTVLNNPVIPFNLTIHPNHANYFAHVSVWSQIFIESLLVFIISVHPPEKPVSF